MFVEETVVPITLLPSIGYVVTAFSALDIRIDLTIAHVLKTDRDTAFAFASAMPNYRPRVELLQRLVRLHIKDETKKNKMDTLLKAVMEVADQRHRLIHDYQVSWSHGEERLQLRRKEATFTKERKTTEITKASLKDLGNRIIDLTVRLRLFCKDDPEWTSGAQFPSRDKLPRRFQ